MSVTIEFDDPALKARLANLPDQMLDWAEEALNDRAHYMAAVAQVTCPVDTGSLRDSIRVERGGEGMYWRQFRVRCGGYVVNPKTQRLVDYAVYVEANTPFMLPAYEAIADDLAVMIKDNVVTKVEAMKE